MKIDLNNLWLLVPFLPLAGVAFAVNRNQAHRRKTGRSPQTEKLLRPAGYSLSRRLDENNDRMLNLLLGSCVLSTLAGFSIWTLIDSINNHTSITWWASAGAAAILFFIGSGVCAFKTFTSYEAGLNFRLGMRGEQAVAEALTEAAKWGFNFFHDLPGDGPWNVDHIAVGSRGVFLLETKAWRKQENQSKSGQRSHEIIYDGECLKSPSFQTRDPLKQAEGNARWLSNYLRNKTGEPVQVNPIVVFPGWFIIDSTKGNFPVKVMNPKGVAHYLNAFPEKIDIKQVNRIKAALDEKCRDVEF